METLIFDSSIFCEFRFQIWICLYILFILWNSLFIQRFIGKVTANNRFFFTQLYSIIAQIDLGDERSLIANYKQVLMLFYYIMVSITHNIIAQIDLGDETPLIAKPIIQPSWSVTSALSSRRFSEWLCNSKRRGKCNLLVVIKDR